MADKERMKMDRSEMKEINGGGGDFGTGARFETVRYYIVQVGDTLQSIAASYHVSELQIKKWNGLNSNSDLQPGMSLKIYQ